MNAAKGIDCPSWCTGEMHSDGLAHHHDGTIGGDPHQRSSVDLVKVQDEPVHAVAWIDGNCLNFPADPALMRDAGRAFLEAAERLDALVTKAQS